MIPTTKFLQGEETKAKLIVVGRELFAKQGHAGVALEDLCEKAGVTRGALYHHFPGKNDLFRAVCESVAADIESRVLSGLRSQSDPWERLRLGCETFLDVSLEPQVRQILLSDAPSVLGWHEFRKIDERHGLGLLQSGLKAAFQGDSVSPAQMDFFAHMLVAALNEMAMMLGQSEDRKSARLLASQGLNRLLAGFSGTRP